MNSKLDINLTAVQQASVNDHVTRHLSSVLPGISFAIHTPVSTAYHQTAEDCSHILNLPQCSSAIVVLIDGLGYWNLAERIGHAPYLRSLLHNNPENNADTASINTCYPSTTVAALGTFGTGTCPGLTGMLGYTQLNPENHHIAQMIKFVHAIAPEKLQQQPTILEKIEEAGGQVSTVGLPDFKRSPLTRAALRGSQYTSQVNDLRRAYQAAENAHHYNLTYLYIRIIDKAGHKYGWESDEWAASLENADQQLQIVRNNMPHDSALIITADHGMININYDHQIDIATIPVLNHHIACIGGEPRALMLYVKKDTDPQETANEWANYLKDQAIVLTKQEAIQHHVFGEVAPHVLPMIGDVIVMCTGDTTIVDSRVQPSTMMSMPGVHGSLTEYETRIPLLIDYND